MTRTEAYENFQEWAVMSIGRIPRIDRMYQNRGWWAFDTSRGRYQIRQSGHRLLVQEPAGFTTIQSQFFGPEPGRGRTPFQLRKLLHRFKY